MCLSVVVVCTELHPEFQTINYSIRDHVSLFLGFFSCSCHCHYLHDDEYKYPFKLKKIFEVNIIPFLGHFYFMKYYYLLLESRGNLTLIY